MGSLVSSSSEDVEQRGFAIDRRRHVPHGKTDLLSDSSVRCDGSALTMLLCSASGISVTYCFVHEILQRGPYASILGEGYAGLARRRADRAHSLPPSSRRAAPPIYPDLIYDRHRQQNCTLAARIVSRFSELSRITSVFGRHLSPASTTKSYLGTRAPLTDGALCQKPKRNS